MIGTFEFHEQRKLYNFTLFIVPLYPQKGETRKYNLPSGKSKRKAKATVISRTKKIETLESKPYDPRADELGP